MRRITGYDLMTRIFLLAVLLAAGVASAKPLLTDSQSTYVTSCLAKSDTPERLLSICQHALSESGMSEQQRHKVLNALAWAHFDLGDAARAEQVFKSLLQENGESQIALSGLGWLAREREEFRAAAKYFRRATARKITAGDLAGLASSEYRIQALSRDAAILKLDSALAIDPKLAWGWREKGWILGEDGALTEALAAFREAARIDPDSVSSRYALTWIHTEMDNWEEALTAANRTLEVQPDHFYAISRRSLALLFLDRPKQALEDAETLIALQPDNSDGYVRKARAYAALGWRRLAIEETRRAEARLGKDSYLIYWRAQLLYDDGQYAEAMQHANQLVASGGGDYFDHKLRAWIALELGDVATARHSISAVLSKRPGDKWGLELLAHVHVSAEDYELAISVFSKAMEAGLPEDRVGIFAGALSQKNQYLKAVAVRGMFEAD